MHDLHATKVASTAMNGLLFRSCFEYSNHLNTGFNLILDSRGVRYSNGKVT